LSDERAYVHSRFGGVVSPDDIAPYVLLPTTAAWAAHAALLLDEPRLVTEHYEFTLYSGRLRGVPISVCSTGLGGMSVSIAVEELAQLGAHTFIAVGARGFQADGLAPEALVVPLGAVRLDGTSHDYVRPEYPAAAHFEVVMAALAAAEAHALTTHTGIVASVGAGEASLSGGARSFLSARQQSLVTQLRDAKVWWGGGQEATLFVLASLYRLRAGALVAQSADGSPASVAPALDLGVQALLVLATWDAQKQHAGSRYAIPSVPKHGTATT
jgi:uridine phosphorylase